MDPDTVSYLRNLKLTPRDSSPPKGEEFATNIKMSGYKDGFTFSKSVSSECRRDIQIAMLLAELAAENSAFRNSKKWYNKYMEVLGKTGFYSKQIIFQKHKIFDGSLTNDEAVDVLNSISKLDGMAKVKSSLDAMKIASKASDAHIVTYNIASNIFKDEKGDVILNLCTLYFIYTASKKQMDLVYWHHATRSSTNALKLYSGEIHKILVDKATEKLAEIDL